MEETKKMNKGFKIFFLIFAILILVFLKEDNQQKFVEFFNDLTKKEKEIILDKEYKGENLSYINGALVKWDDNILTFLNDDGSDRWVKEFDFVEPQVIYGDKSIYVIDKAAGDIYQLDSKGETIFKKQLFKSIFNIKSNNNSLIIHLKEEGIESLQILDKDGNSLTELEVKGSILTYSLKNDSTKYAYSSIIIDESKINSKLIVNSIDNKEEYNIEIPNEIVVATEFIKDEVVMVTDSSIKIIGRGKIKWTKEYPLIKDVFIKDDEIYLLYGDNLEIIDLKGDIKSKTTFGMEYNRVKHIGNYVVLYGNMDLLVIENGKEISKYIAEENIVDVTGNNNSIIIKYKNKVEVLRFDLKENID